VTAGKTRRTRNETETYYDDSVRKRERRKREIYTQLYVLYTRKFDALFNRIRVFGIAMFAGESEYCALSRIMRYVHAICILARNAHSSAVLIPSCVNQQYEPMGFTRAFAFKQAINIRGIQLVKHTCI